MSVTKASETWARRFPASERRERLTQQLLLEARAATVDAATAARLRNEALEANRTLALSLARRYHHKGVENEDVDQVAMVGLCLAVDRWDPSADTPFVAFAGPTIAGEIKRYFRDRAWLVRPPRSVQNRVAEVRATAAELRSELAREPSATEIAQRLGVAVQLVEDAHQAGDAFYGSRLEQDDSVDWAAPALVERSGTESSIESLADSLDLRRAVAQLPERDRRLVRLRFVDELTQQEVGRRLGVSQMQVSRLLVRVLATLRESLEPTEDTPNDGRSAA
jgi:RNA polymerase sigma-B factor